MTVQACQQPSTFRMLQSPSMGNDLELLPLELLCPVIPAAPVPILVLVLPWGCHFAELSSPAL